MASLNPPVCNFDMRAPDFDLLGVDGKRYTLANSVGKSGLLVMFICNHCPYIKAIKTRLVADCRELLQYGINTIAIQSNDTKNYPDDSFERMQEEAKMFNFSFPYVLDETQEIAKAYGAVCTPDFFGFNANLELQYRGRFDAAGRGEPPADNPRDLLNAMKLIAETRQGPREQIASIGCSIKWFAE
ncbi:thiol-disulfide oxidoreductase ResA [mine drainage metagenome]|uniref:Thiol-disulfide oxidoreductase ResA n=1 Tax=mine drainage metagenome TaxID=410659 RepID=A0A1J5SRJ7_9ZZZZ